MKTIHPIAALALSTLVLAGCGKEVVVGGQRELETVATGDATPEGASTSRAGDARFAFAGEPLAQARVQGTAAFTADVRLLTSFRTPVVPGATSPTAVRLDGGDTVRVARWNVPSATYTEARVVFRNVVAQVTSGLTVGGLTVTGTVLVDIAPGDSVVVSAVLPFSAEADARERLLIDLDASAWLAATNPVTRRVPVAAFRNAVKLRLEQR